MSPILETERLKLRYLVQSDFQAIDAMGKDAEVMEFITFGKLKTSEENQADLDRWIGYCDGRFGVWAVINKVTEDFLGWVCLKALPNPEEIEIGWRFARSAWGRGFATEASKELMRYGFEELQLSYICAIALPENMASRRIMEKLGMSYIRNGEWYGLDLVYYRKDS